jgi:hypothetical protein
VVSLYAIRDTRSGRLLGCDSYEDTDYGIRYYLNKTISAVWVMMRREDVESVVNNLIISSISPALPENDGYYGHLEVVELAIAE